jgi:glycosyltransferase involved in cell wall biosynthesis
MEDVINILRDFKNSLNFKIIENCNNPIPPFDCDEIDKYIFFSRFVKKLQKPPQQPNKTAIIYPGVNMEEFNFNINNRDPYTIGLIYRLTDDKISRDTIDTLIKLCKEIPKLTIHIIGHGPNFRYYAKRCRESRVRNQFVFAGMIVYSKLSRYYERFHLFLAPVHHESYGVVVPYALAKGVYVIAYDTQCLEELIGTKEYLSTSEDDLIAKVKRFMDPPCNDISILKSNRERAESLFSLEKMLKDYSTIYDDLLKELPST